MNDSFGKKVRFYRELRGKTQKDLSDYLGYKTSSSVAKIEDGTNDVPLSVVSRIADFLRIDVTVFFEPLQTGDDLMLLYEYLPYLAKASDETIRNIRFMLGMSVEEKKDGISTEKEMKFGSIGFERA